MVKWGEKSKKIQLRSNKHSFS